MMSLKGQFNEKMFNYLKEENEELKLKLQNVEKEYLEVFKNLKYLENESYLSKALEKKVNLFENEDEFLKGMRFDDSVFTQYQETFRLSKSVVKDVLNFFVTKQDFFNSNIYENLDRVKSSERCRENNIKSCFIKFSAIGIFYEKLVLDLMNKVALDLKIKQAETEYNNSLSSVINGLESLFLNYNNVVEEIKRIKLDEVYKAQEAQIDAQVTVTSINNRNTPRQVITQGNIDTDNKSNIKKRSSFLMANLDQRDEKLSYGLLNPKKHNNNNIVKKVNKALSKQLVSIKEETKNKHLRQNLDNSQDSNLTKPNKFEVPKIFNKDERLQFSYIINETDENEERDKLPTEDNLNRLNNENSNNIGNSISIVNNSNSVINNMSFKRKNSNSSIKNSNQQVDNGTSNTNQDVIVSSLKFSSPLKSKRAKNSLTPYTITENTQSKVQTSEDVTFDELKLPNALKNFAKRKTLNASAFKNPLFGRRISRIDFLSEQINSFNPNKEANFLDNINSLNNINLNENISEIKQLKLEIEMYKQYVSTINDKLENEVKLKNSYLESLKQFERRNKIIYKTEIDNLHMCYETYKDFYKNELDYRKEVILYLHSTLEEVLANANFDLSKPSKNFFSNFNINYNISNVTNFNSANSDSEISKNKMFPLSSKATLEPVKLRINKDILNLNSNSNSNFITMNSNKSPTFKKKEINYNYSSSRFNNDSQDLSNIHYRNHSLGNYSLVDYYRNRSFKTVFNYPTADIKESLVNLFYDESGSATKKLDFIKISLNETNDVKVVYGNGLGSKHKGKSPLTKPFTFSFDGDYCNDVCSDN